jgi:hypothetical protein
MTRDEVNKMIQDLFIIFDCRISIAAGYHPQQVVIDSLFEPFHLNTPAYLFFYSQCFEIVFRYLMHSTNRTPLQIMTISMVLKLRSQRKHRARLVFGLVAV